MKHFEYIPKIVCAKKIEFDLDEDNIIHNVKFTGGCNGNLKAIAILLEGVSAVNIIAKLKDNTCGNRLTSCVDQLAIAIEEVITN